MAGCASAPRAARAGAAPSSAPTTAPAEPPAVAAPTPLEAMPEEPITEALRQVDPAFRQTVREYNAEIWAATHRAGTEQEASLRRAIVLLADAIETIPFAEPIDLQAAATQIRMARHHPMVAAQLELTPSQEHQRALHAVAEALNLVAIGPYERASSVGEHVRVLQAAVERLGDPLASRRSEERVLDALLEAKTALRSILEAAAVMEASKQ